MSTWSSARWAKFRRALVRVPMFSNNFSRRHTVRFRLGEARREFDKLKLNSEVTPNAAWAAESKDIEEHLAAAAEMDGNRVPLETILRHLMAAEQKLMAFFPIERLPGAIDHVERDIDTLMRNLPEERRNELKKPLDDARENIEAEKSVGTCLQPVLQAKVLVDGILLELYRTREQLRDGIVLLGLILFVINLLVLFFLWYWDLQFEIDGTSVSSGRAVLIGMLFGGVGACLSGLYRFAIDRRALGEFETPAVTVVRPLIGATSGMLGAALVAAGILDFGNQPLSGLAIAAFILGFSERLVMGTVEKLGGHAEARLPGPNAK